MGWEDGEGGGKGGWLGGRGGRMGWEGGWVGGWVGGRRLSNGWEVVSRQEATHAGCAFVPLPGLIRISVSGSTTPWRWSLVCVPSAACTQVLFSSPTLLLTVTVLPREGPTASHQQGCPGPAPYLYGGSIGVCESL